MLESRDPAKHKNRRTLTIALFITAVSLYWGAQYIYAPTLPSYVESKSDNLALVGVVLSMYGLWQVVVRLPLGIAADWLGSRKPFIIIGLVLTGFGAWTLGTAGDVRVLIIGRSITGVAAATWVPMVVIFSSLFPAKDAVRASAMLTFVCSASRMLATGLTGWLNTVGGYSLPFFIAAGLAAMSILVILPMPEERQPRRRPSLNGIGTLAMRRDVLIPSLLQAVGQYATWSTSFTFLPLLAEQHGASDVALSLLMTLYIAVVTFGNLMTTTLVRRFGTRRLMPIGFTLLGLGIGMAALAPSLPFVFVAQMVIGLSQGANYPILMGMSIQDVAESQRTTAMGLHQAVYAIGMFTGPWLSGLLADALGLNPMFGITAVSCLLLGLLGARWMHAPRPQAAAQRQEHTA